MVFEKRKSFTQWFPIFIKRTYGSIELVDYYLGSSLHLLRKLATEAIADIVNRNMTAITRLFLIIMNI